MRALALGEIVKWYNYITLNVFLFEQKVFSEQESAELIPFFGSNMAKQIDIVIIISNFRSEFLAACVGIF